MNHPKYVFGDSVSWVEQFVGTQSNVTLEVQRFGIIVGMQGRCHVEGLHNVDYFEYTVKPRVGDLCAVDEDNLAPAQDCDYSNTYAQLKLI